MNADRRRWGKCVGWRRVCEAQHYKWRFSMLGRTPFGPTYMLTERDQQANQRKSKVRARVEHIFGSISNEQGGLYSRVIGLARTTVKVGLMNVVQHAAFCDPVQGQCVRRLINRG